MLDIVYIIKYTINYISVSLDTDGFCDQCFLCGIANALEEDHEAGSSGACGVKHVAHTSERATHGACMVTRHNDVLGHDIEVVVP